MPSNPGNRPLRPGSPEWWLRREADATRRRPRADGLSVHQITAAAAELVDNHGAEALTMRRLAEHLGTAPSSLYRHVASREEVLALIVDAVRHCPSEVVLLGGAPFAGLAQSIAQATGKIVLDGVEACVQAISSESG